MASVARKTPQATDGRRDHEWERVGTGDQSQAMTSAWGPGEVKEKRGSQECVQEAGLAEKGRGKGGASVCLHNAVGRDPRLRGFRP